MKRMAYRVLINIAVATITLVSGYAAAAEAPAVSVKNARIRLLPGDLPLAGYFEITNKGHQSLRLQGATSSAFAMIHMHRSVEKNGQSHMVAVDYIEIDPGATVKFAPGGYHLMLMHRRRTLKVGDHVPMALKFEGGQTILAGFAVQSAGAQ
jgi:copper(I)-binding protein